VRPRLIVLLACGGALAAGAAAAADHPTLAIGTPAPDFSSRDAVTHQPVSLSAQQGKVVVLTFWATWCAPCRKELPVLEGLQRKLGKDRLVVYAVPWHEPEQTYGSLVKAARAWQITLVDDKWGGIAAHYGIRAIPHLFLVGRDGRISAEHTGYGEGSVEQLVADVNEALRPPAPPSN
jgi:thiol-disulfide isomerase/thioredoxin